MSVTFVDGHSLLSMFEIGSNLDKWLGRLHDPEMLSPVGKDDDAYLKTLMLPLNADARPRLTDDQKSSVFRLLTMLLRAIPHSRDMVVHILASNSALLSYAVPQIATNVVCAAGAVRSLRLLFRGRCFDGNGDYPICLSSFFWAMKATPCEGNCDDKRSVLRFECLLVMFDMLQISPTIKLTLLQAILRGTVTEAVTRSEGLGARNLMATCMMASTRSQLEDEDSQRLHYNASLNGCCPKTDLMASIIALSITDTKANRSSVRIGEYVLPVKQGPPGGESGEEISSRTGRSNPVSMIRRSEMVRTPSTEHNMVQLSQAVLTGRPIIVQGGSGAGKSFMIRELAVAMNKAEELVELHVNDQTDAKALIGAYVCSDIPGEFIWQYGVLTQAVLSGRWVVVENIDSVPVEFLASIAPLLSRRRLHLPNRNMEVSAHPSFRLFGTRVLSSKSHRVGVGSEVVVPVDYNSLIYIPTMHHFSYDWHYVTVLDMDSSEVKDVLMQKFPQLLPEVVHRLMAVHQLLNDSSSSIDQSRSRRSIHQSKKFGLREMIKVAARIRANCGQFNFTSGFLTAEQRRLSFQEVADVFAGSMRSKGVYLEAITELAALWGISLVEADAFFFSHSAMSSLSDYSIRASCGVVRIGRVTLSMRIGSEGETTAAADPSSSEQTQQQFAFNKYSSRLLEQVAACVSRNEATLLVGETGTGKTTTVQELAAFMKQKLVVQNLSLSTDVSDLLGGYRPVTLRQLFLPVYTAFVQLFHDTLSSSQNEEFLLIVAKLFQNKSWHKLLKAFRKAAKNAVQKLEKAVSAAAGRLSSSSAAAAAAISKQAAHRSNISRWRLFDNKVARYEANISKIEFGFAFAFVDGLLVEALREGHWVLLDEINLAAPETLQALSGVLDPNAAVFLTEKNTAGGELTQIKRHPDFRVFAAMNPPTDVGKKELPMALSSRFTELFCDELVDPSDLEVIVQRYLEGISNGTSIIRDIVSVYLGCRAAAEDHLSDSTGQRPRYSLRSLTRSLQAAKSLLAIGIRPFPRAIFEALLLNFQTMLSEGGSKEFMHTYLKQSLYPECSSKELNMPPSRPGGRKTTGDDWVLVKPFWLHAGPLSTTDWAVRDGRGITRFVLTSKVESYIRCLAAFVGADVAPILIQGPTSIGKTSMVEYLAARCGYKCVRINNHEHTDIQEYVGGYVTNHNGQLEFKDGLLVEALRKGHWIILDELNLAPSEVLEALNRLLDDNKELLIPETGEVIKSVKGFKLFATQNPPGIYGGRKPLSRAFKNRFFELSVSDLPLSEVEQIITESCGIAPKFSHMLVQTMQELQVHRQKSTLFQGKYGAVTTRDLIKWGRRAPNSSVEVAAEGYMILAEKLRSQEEKDAVLDILNRVCRVQLDAAGLYRTDHDQSSALDNRSSLSPRSYPSLAVVQMQLRSGELEEIEGMQSVAVTHSMSRMWELINRGLQQSEPILLIGETGCGKTSICQLYSACRHQPVRILNCHQSTETADLIGGLRPVRSRESIRRAVVEDIGMLVGELLNYSDVMTLIGVAHGNGDVEPSSSSSVRPGQRYDHLKVFHETWQVSADDGSNTFSEVQLKACIDSIAEIVSKIDSRDVALSVDSKRRRPAKDEKTADIAAIATIHGDRRDEKETMSLLLTTVLERAQSNWQRCRSIFEWQDGPLVTAMKQGDIFVMDEVNLAEDSVIERLNSVLESGRTITLAEKGGGVASEVIVAHPNFRFLATMNPGGDFGKRELSPALRSRFTEIWVPAASDDGDMLLIVREVIALKHLADSEPQLVDGIAQSMISCMRWINEQSLQWLVTGINVSVREILAWAKFISQSAPSSAVEAYRCYIHGAFMMILDGLGIGINASRDRINQFKADCLLFLLSQCPEHTLRDVSSEEFFVNTSHSLPVTVGMSTHALTVGSFSIPLVGPLSSERLLLSGPQQQHSTSTIQQDYQYTFNAKITLLNLGRIVRAMQLPRAILLEGPPGVGKSSLIANLASMTGHTLVRINLSEHSELSDLLGTDLPASSFADAESPDDADDVTAVMKSDRTDATVSQFRWCDGVFLQAMKLGHWVLLDELNLAPQSVLEGLNACFDHRHEVFLPDIGKTIVCSPTFRVFCAQNPMAEGGGRKGLPQSFLSRFSRVFIESMSEDDLFEVSSCAFHVSRQRRAVSLGTVSPHAPTGLELYLRPMVGFVQGLHKRIVELSSFGQIGGPWEFNLRDIFRWYELTIAVMMRCGSEEKEEQDEDSLRDAICTSAYVLFVRRMRTREDRLHLCAEFNRVFGFPLLVDVSPSIRSVRDRGIGQTYLVIGCAKEVILLQPHYTHRNRSVCDALDVGRMIGADAMQGHSKSLESLLHCVSMRWPALLVGPCGSGKRRCVEYLAMQTGHVVEHYSASTATDSTDLLGSFEQVSAYRHLALAIDFLQSSAMTLLNIALLELSNATQDSELLAAFIASCSRVLADLQRIYEQSLVVAELNALELQRGRELVTGIEGLSDALLSLVHHELGRLGSAAASAASSEVRQLVEASRLQLTRTVSCSSAGFEWVDGIVLRAVQNGHWLVVDNINLCAASVLDRLNSLLEPGGSLLLTEGGEGRVIVPHDDFRIFFCMDPVSSAFGEISRAMRNRCVEIAFSEEDACNNYLLARCCLSTRSRSEEMMSLPLQSAVRSLCDCLDLCSRDRSPSTHLYGLPKHFPRFRLFSRIMSLFDINRRHGKSELSSMQSSIDAVLPGFSSQIDLSSCSDIVTRDDAHPMEESSSVYRCYVQELLTSSFIPQEVFMILVSIGMAVEGMGSPTAVDDLWMDRIVRQAEAKHSLQYARYHEMVPKMVSSSILLLDASRDNQPNSSTLMNRLIRLTRSDDLSAQSWLDDVICSAMAKIHLHQEYLWWSEKHADLDEEVSASTPQCEEYARRRILSRFRVLLITDRCITIEQERLSIDTVRRFSGDYMRMDSDHLHSSLSLFTIAVGISEGIFTADSRELNILSHLYRLIEAVDGLIGAVLKHISGTHQSDLILAASVERSLHHLVLKRDTLSHVLCTSECQMDRLSKQQFPWDDISTCSNWLRKAVQRIVSSVFGEDSYSTSSGSCSSLLDVCVSVEAEVNRFECSVCAYWQRPQLMQKLRLWKEGGHAVVPASSTQCDTLFALRRVIVALDDTEEEGRGRRCSAVDMVVTSLSPLAGYRRLHSLSVAKEWLSLYSTFYWVCTKEDECLHKRSGLGGRVGDRGVSSVGRSPKPFVDIASLMGALSDKISAHLLANSLHDTAAIAPDTAADFDLDLQGDPVGGTQYTAVVHRQISRERAYAGEQTVDALVELMVVRNMMMLIDSCSSILLQASQTSLACPDVDVEGLNSLRRCCSHTILLALRYTTIPASDLREIQTLEWAIDSVVVVSKDTMRTMIDPTRLEVLLQLLRVFVVTLETRIFSMLLYLKANHPETLKYTYDSPTLSLLIYSNAASSGLYEASMYTSFKRAAAEESFIVPWEHSVNSSIAKLLQPTAADMTSRYIDLQALCTRYHGNGKLLKYLTCSTASISVSSIHIAKKRMLQLMRVVAQSSSSRRSSTVIHRINQLGIYTLDVLTACRDFYPSEVCGRLFELIASCGHSTGLYDHLLNMQLHRSVNDACVSHMFALCLPPVLEYLSRVLGAPQLDDISSISIAGRAWVSIGLLRLHLLLPSVPIDPAAKPAIKARLLTASNDNLAVNVRADYLCHAVSEKALLTPEMIESYEEHTQRAADIERLNSRGIMRPTAGVSFIELYEEVQSAMDGFLSISRLQDILTKTATGKDYPFDGHGLQKEDIISRDAVRVVVQEEQAWQANAASFVDRLQANFAAFEDITSTVASAVSNISSGLRLIVSHFYRDVASSSSVSSSVDADMTMWVDVMQYPFSCSASLYQHPHHHQSSFNSAALKRDLLHPVACLLSGIDQLVDRAAVGLAILQSTRGDRPASALNDASHSCELPDAKSVRSMTPHVILLHALSRIEYLVRGRSIMLEDVYPAFQSTLSKFVESYLKGLDERRRREAEKEALYRHRSREQVFESNEAKEEEAALKRHFPHHLEDEFRTMPGILKDAAMEYVDANKVQARNGDDDGDDVHDVSSGHQSAANEEASSHRVVALSDTFDEASTAEVVGHHARLTFFALFDQLMQQQQGWMYSASAAAGLLVGAKSGDLLSAKQWLQLSLCENTLVTSKALSWALNGVLAPGLDGCLRGTSLMSLAMMVQSCPTDIITAAAQTGKLSLSRRHAQMQVHGKKAINPVRHHLHDDSVDRDLLLLLSADSDIDIDSSSSSHKPLDFHKDPNPLESAKASGILQAIFDRSSELLSLFPGNELLLQVCRVSAKISEFHVSTSIGKMLISVQLLLQKAEEWELYAARHVSLREEMNRLGVLISEWRELELRSWETLLRSKEVSHARKAEYHWYTLMRVLHSEPLLCTDDYEPIAHDPHEPSHPWPSLEQFSPTWLRTGYRTPLNKFKTASAVPCELSEHQRWKMEMMDQVVRVGMTRADYLSQLFSTLESFLSQSSVGEFPARLHLIRLFALQLQLEHRLLLTEDRTHNSTKQVSASKKHEKHRKKSSHMAELKGMLANIVCGIWHYFDQFLPIVRKFQDVLKDPIQARLKGEVKMGKWDQLNTYALIEYSDKIHRKLNKFLREYETDVLDYPVSALIRKEVMEDFVNKAGELQPVFEVPSMRVMFPALEKLDDEGTAATSSASDSDGHSLWIASSVSPHGYTATDAHLVSVEEKLPRLSKLDAYLLKMRKYLSVALDTKAMVESQHAIADNASNRSACYGWLAAMMSEGLCCDVFQRIESLQQKGGQDNTSKPMKQRAVRDLLQTLKEHGISHLRSTVSEELRHNTELFSVRAPLGCELMADLTWSCSRPRNVFERGEVYFAKNILELTQLRGQGRSCYSSDISPRDSAIMLSLSENMLVEMTKLRCTIGASLEEFKSFSLALLKADACCSTVDPSADYRRSSSSTLHDVLHLQMDLKVAMWVNNVMLDNLVQLQSLVVTAALAHEGPHVEEDAALEVLSTKDIHAVKDTLQAILDLLASISMRAEADEHTAGGRSINAVLGLDSSLIGTIALHSNVNDSLDATAARELLERNHETVSSAFQLFNDPVQIKGMSALASADVVSTVQERLHEMYQLISSSRITVHRDDDGSGGNAVSQEHSHGSSVPSSSDRVLRFGGLVSSCIEDCLVSVQKVRSIADMCSSSSSSSSLRPFKGCFGESLTSSSCLNDNGMEASSSEAKSPSVPVPLQDCIALSISSLAACQLQKISEHVTTICGYWGADDKEISEDERISYSLLLQKLLPMCQLVASSFASLFEGVVSEYKSFGKLLYVCLRIFRTLLAKGICSAQQSDGGEDDHGPNDLSGMIFQDDVEGTGMGEGEGKKDVSDQIENEEQLLGLKDDKPKDDGKEPKKPQEKKTLNDEEKDKGVEMAQDFEGEMYDIPEDDEEDGHSDEDDDKEEPEKEIGDANMDDIVDEKQWDEDEDAADDEEGGEQEDKEKFEKDSKMQGEALEGEMRTHDDEDDARDDQEELSPDNKEKDESKGIKPEEKDDQPPGDAVNEEDEESVAEKPMGVDVRENKPKEGDDDGDDDGEEEEEDNEAGDKGLHESEPQAMDDGEQKDNNYNNNDDLPEEMNLEGSDDGDEGPEPPDEEDPTGEDDGIDRMDEDDPEDGGSSESDDENDDEQNNQERTALTESCGDLPEQQQEVEEPKEDEDRDRSAVELPKAADDQTPAAYGIRSDKGKDSLLNGADEGDEHNTDDIDKQDGSNSDQRDPSAMKAHQPQGKGGRSQGESRDGQSHEVGGSNRDEQPVKPTSRELEPPNPFKNPGDVNEKWHRRLNLVLPPNGDGDGDDAAESDGGGGDDDVQDVEDGLGKGLYEHASKEEGAMEQVLADAPEEDAVQLPEGGERSEDLPDRTMGQDDEGPSDLQNDRPDFDSDNERKRDRSQDEDRYTGQKAKKKRLNNNDSRADVGNEDRNEEISNDEDANDDGVPMDEDNQSDTESRSADEAVVETREVNLSDSSKVVTKESFQFGPRSTMKEKRDEGVLDAPEAAAEEVKCRDFDPREVSQSSLLRGRQLWQHYRQSTESYAMRLCEQLRLILEPTLATRLRGDYRTGKRINMRKVIPYVASGFRKDKIWLRRTKPAKRAYQVMVMIDDSSSMGSAGPLALSSLAMIATAMTRLEIGELSIASFAEDVTVLHKFGTPFTDECGASIVSRFHFEASRTMLSASLHAVKAVFDDARGSICQMSNLSSTAVLQLCFVISDARIDSDNREHLEAKVRALSEQNILVVLVIIDRSGDPKDSIFNTRSVSFVGNKVVTRSYFDDFPFPYYVAIQHIEALPDVLSNALKQWFELIHLQLSNH